TVRRPPEFYEHMMDGERAALHGMPEPVRKLLGSWQGWRGAHLHLDGSVGTADPGTGIGPALTPAAFERRLPSIAGLVHPAVPSVELLEVQLVNAIAPFMLNARLKPLMLRTPERDKHIVNVSAVEGQFYRNFKTTRHPHTNMAKAALNMLTRTAAADYQADGI